jgi:predicted small secreted protein
VASTFRRALRLRIIGSLQFFQSGDPTMRMMTRFCALALVLLALGGCNTMEGLGEDIQSLGESLEGSAEKNGAE